MRGGLYDFGSSRQELIPCKRDRVIPRIRRRSEHFYRAQNSLYEIADWGGDFVPDVSILERHFNLWLSKYHDSFMRLSRPDKVLFLRAVNRFSGPYRSALRARMRRMRDIDWAVKIEVTLDPKLFMNLSGQYVFLPRLWNVISRWLRRTYGKFEFLRILEITKKARPHLHILLAFHDDKWQRYFRSMRRSDKSMRFQAFYNELKDVSMRNNGGWVWARPIQGSLRLVNYVMKYVNKSISASADSSVSDQSVKYGALLFASNRRLFGVSKGLRVFAEPKKPNQGFTYDGIVGGSELHSFCRDQSIPFGMVVSVEPGMIDPYNYPGLIPWHDSFSESGGHS